MSHTTITMAGEGNLLKVSITSTMTTVANNVEIDGPESSREGIETTNLASTVKTKRPSRIPDPGEIDLTANFDPQDTTHQYLQSSFAQGNYESWEILFIDGTTATFTGWIEKWKPTGMKVDENVQFEMTIQLTTMVTWTPGSTQLASDQ